MKIKNIDKETKHNKKEYILPIAKAGLSLGLTVALIKSGMIDYDAMLNWEELSDVFTTLKLDNLPSVGSVDINNIFNLVKTGVTTFGLNTIIVASKGVDLAKEILKPISESEKVQNNSTILKIKEVFKGKSQKEEPKKPKALVNLAKNSLALGFKAYMIASGQIDYNSVYDLTTLPHKFTQIAQIAENIDLNKLKMGIESLKILPQFFSEIKQEKKEGISHIPKISFKDIFSKISKEFPPLTRVTDLAYVQNMVPNKQLTENQTDKQGEDRAC